MTTTHKLPNGGTLTYLNRVDWGANTSYPRKGYQLELVDFVGLILHHTVMVLADWDGDGITHGDLDDISRYMQRLQTIRPDLGLDVPYSFVVFRGAGPNDVVICEGRGWTLSGAHTAGPPSTGRFERYNYTRYGVAIGANTMTEPVTDGMVEGIRWIGDHLPGPAEPTQGHHESYATACPGTNGKSILPQIQPPFETDPITGAGKTVTTYGKGFHTDTGKDVLVTANSHGAVFYRQSGPAHWFYQSPAGDITNLGQHGNAKWDSALARADVEEGLVSIRFAGDLTVVSFPVAP